MFLAKVRLIIHFLPILHLDLKRPLTSFDKVFHVASMSQVWLKSSKYVLVTNDRQRWEKSDPLGVSLPRNQPNRQKQRKKKRKRKKNGEDQEERETKIDVQSTVKGSLLIDNRIDYVIIVVRWYLGSMAVWSVSEVCATSS